MAEEHDGPENLSEPPAFFPKDLAGDYEVRGGDLLQVRVDGVFAAESDGSIARFVVLSEGGRRLPILIGPFEATAISLPLDGARADRPMTHDLLNTVVERLGGRLARVVIDDLWNGIFYARMIFEQGGAELEIDARPSDAVALAVRCGAPIFVSDDILATAEG